MHVINRLIKCCQVLRAYFLFYRKPLDAGFFLSSKTLLIESSWSEMKETAFSISLFLVSSLIK